MATTSRAKSTNRIKAKVWMPTMTAEVDGPIIPVIAQLFCAVNSKSDRADLLKKLAETDQRMTDAEDAKARPI